MNTLIPSLAIVVLLFNLIGCKHEPPTRYICLLDISGSIYPEEVDREFAEMQKLASEMKRGDELVLYPITGNARNDLPGHILRLAVSTSRTAYDSDLTVFRKSADAQIAQMRDWAKANPAKHTDILGTLGIASREADHGYDVDTRLIIMSDFLEDESRYNFVTDRSLNSTRGASALAESEGTLHQINFYRATIYLQRIHSVGAASLSHTRLDAIDEFWEKFLQQDGKQAVIHVDAFAN